MRIFQNKPFQRFARKERINEASLCEAVRRAERGLIDADLGGDAIKQRLPRPGEGRSGGFRSLILYRVSDRAFLVYGYAKSDRENITPDELAGFRELAKVVLAYDEAQMRTAVEREIFSEVNRYE